jgi:hypothetical protein
LASPFWRRAEGEAEGGLSDLKTPAWSKTQKRAMNEISVFGMASAISLFSVSTLFAQLPADTPGLRLWLDASDASTIFTDGGGLVDAWEDKSGNGFHATQTDAARKPSVGAGVLGGANAIHFDSAGGTDANNDGLAIDTGLFLGRPYTAYIVDQYWGAVQGRTLQGLTTNWLLGKWGGGNAHYAGGWVGPAGGVPAVLSTPTIASGVGRPNYSQFNINGSFTGYSGALDSPGNMLLGFSDGGGFNETSQSDIAEVIIYGRLLGVNERDAMDAYLGTKYGIPVSRRWLSTRVDVFTGADPGEGLDFSGNFLYAVNARGPGGFAIGDASFTDDTGIIVSENEILNWFPASFTIDTPDDNNLNTLMQSIRYTTTNGVGIEDVKINLTGLTAGKIYKLQLLFGDSDTARHWAISIDGDKVLTDEYIAAYTGTSTAAGAALVHEFVARKTALDIVLSGISLVGGDINPIIQGLTLEDQGPLLNTASTKVVNSAADLDFSGTFVYAVNAFGAAAGQVGDAFFTDDNISGVTISAPNMIADGAWVIPDLGSTTDDDNLETVLRSIRWSGNDSHEKPLAIDFTALTAGQTYKLQLLFDDSGTARGFDIALDGVLIVNNFSAAPSAPATAAVAVVIDFTAGADGSAHVGLEGFATPFGDKNPILNGFTLEQTDSDGDDDNDGLPDQWELDNFTHLDQSTDGDPDGDNLTNFQELAFGSDPDEADVDEDGLTDDLELLAGTNPNVDDTDGDTLKDGAELNEHMTSPIRADTDLDYLRDDVEVAGPTNPLILDTDGDGYSDSVEVNAGTLPNDAASVPGAGTYVGNFTGGDVGDGLDLEGSFLYALNIGTNGDPGQIRDANFTADSVLGVTFATQFEAPNWNAGLNLGDTTNDNALEIALASIRWSSGIDGISPDDVTVSLSDLVEGGTYKLQLIFAEACCPNRGFDVFVDGAQIANDFRPGVEQNEPLVNTGAVIIHEFTASSSTVNILLNTLSIADLGISDFNPILNALTLESLPVTGDFAITGVSKTAGAVILEFNGVNGKTYSADYKMTLDSEFWEEIEDSVLSTGEGSQWMDTHSGRLANPTGFYRLRDPILQPLPN